MALIFLRFTRYGRSGKVSCYQQILIPLGLTVFAPRLIFLDKILKILYEVRGESHPSQINKNKNNSCYHQKTEENILKSRIFGN